MVPYELAYLIDLANSDQAVPAPASAVDVDGVGPRGWHTMSAAARRRISAFQRDRWAKVKQQKKAA